jgi:hypothetical protein
MATTWFKRLENRSQSRIKLLNIENPNSRGHNIEVLPGTHIAVDMAIPWAPFSGDFPSKHLELQLNGVTHYWIWQATKDDGDFIRFSTNGAWKNPGDHVFGYAGSANNLFEVIGDWNLEGLAQFFLTDRVLTVLDSHFETIPIQPKQFGQAQHTFIKRLENRSTLPLTLFSTLTSQTVSIGPNSSATIDMEVPWALSANGLFPFGANHLRVALGGVNRFWIWQHDHPNDGDYVRFATAPNWIPFNNRVAGFAETGECPGDLVFTTGRTMIVTNSGIELQPNPLLLDQIFSLVEPHLHQSHIVGGDPQPVPPPSIPKRSAVAFSVAGPVADRFRNNVAGASSTYKETGKRYEFTLGADGRVTATHPDGTKTLLDKARSFTTKRKGEDLTTLPPFDLIAANGGRVFAKAVGTDDFYFAAMEDLFVTRNPKTNLDVSIPSYYFKLDPEFKQQGQQVLDLLETTKTIPDIDHHPACERLPVFRRVLTRQLTDMMIADVKARVWNQLDCRPPQNVMAHAVRDLIPEAKAAFIELNAKEPAAGAVLAIGFVIYTLVKGETPFESMFNLPDTEAVVPNTVATFKPVAYARPNDTSLIEPPAISFKQVLDIGVGTVHHHQQYQRITGCEMQANLSIDLYAETYSFFNGPLTDGDGYCDGTINYYALVENDLGYALLFQDEQAYFSQRWRLVGPDDTAGAMFSLMKDLPSQPGYEWEREKYWSPFDGPRSQQHINAQSRLAVSAQVLLVTGIDPANSKWKIYSINFSWGTMDRTWRWREMPPVDAEGVRTFKDADVLAGNEPIETSATIVDKDHQTGTIRNTVYPQTIRLRDDMTINLKGTRNDVVGRWYQRYLPPDNNLRPLGKDLLIGRQMPADHFDHAWKFLPEPVFQLADKFQFFGAYDENIDTRTQFYEVTPVAGEEANLARSLGPWIDDARQLFVSQWKLKWRDPDRLGYEPIDPPSAYYSDTRLRIEKKGTRWIATFWDKRDDDLKKFEGLPKVVTLKGVAADGTPLTARVNIVAHHNLMKETQTPVVKKAYFWLEPNGMAGVAFEATSPDAVRENVSKVRVASIEAVPAPVTGDPNRVIPKVNQFLNQTTDGSATPIIGNTFEFRWTPSATDRALLQQHGTPGGEQQFATSIWFEDIMGNVAPPESIVWERSPRAQAVATPSFIPLGVPTQVTVHASDLRTGKAITEGDVWVDNLKVGKTDVPFTFTFNTRVETETDREFNPPKVTTTVIEPIVTVTLPQYPDTLVPVQFFTPKLIIRLEPASMPIGPTVQVVVRAEDETTHAPVQGRVFIGGIDVGATNTPFNFAFNSGNTSGEVRAPGYPNKTFGIPLFTPTMQVSVSPSPISTGLPVQVTVRAVDTRTGLPVNGRVKINGVDTAATNTPFTFTFGLTPPSGVVSAQFYPDVAIAWPPLFVSTLTTGLMPMPVPINKTIQCTVSAKNAQTGSLISGRVKINGVDVAATNTPFSTIFKPKPVGAEGELVMPEVSVTAFGYRSTLVDTGF